MQTTRYGQIVDGYTLTRREDPAHARTIAEALGDARAMVKLGGERRSYVGGL